MEEWYKESQEEYMEKWAANVPENPETGKSGLDRLMEEGAWEDQSREPFYEPFAKTLSDEEIQGSQVGEDLIIRNAEGVGIGIMQNGVALRGFKTPSRKFEIRSLFVKDTGLNQDTTELIQRSGMLKTKPCPEQHKPYDVPIAEMPIWLQPIEHTEMDEDQLIMTCLLYTSPSPRDGLLSRMPSSA